MIIYRNSNTDPYFNLAAEQYLLDTKQGSIFTLWRNSASVIIGKNQNAYGELDLDYVEKNGIRVVRRLTGGGAVFHDLGNINFSFIVPGEENASLDFARFTRPIIDAITALGVEDVCLSGRNDILIGKEKISGNAQSSYNGKTLHHGTLLYSADLSMLAGALKVDPEKISAKGIKSVRNRVCNIADRLPRAMTVNEFADYLEKYVAEKTNAEIKDYSANDISAIQKLADEKYSAWDWNFGRSKEFSARKKKRFPFGGVSVLMTAENGRIKDINICGDFFGMKDIRILEDSVRGKRLEKKELEDALPPALVSQCISGMDTESFVTLLLS